MRRADFVACSGEYIDDVLAVFMPAGKSYTGEDQIEIFCHGGRRVIQVIMEQTLAAGARPAEPGEFTRLAFLNGRIDLAEAEAVAEIIAASTEASLRAGQDHLTGRYSEYVTFLRAGLLAALADLEASIDFSEDDVAQIDTETFGQRLRVIHSATQQLAATYRGGRIIREGFRVAICGRPNAGKSSLFNLLLEHERALVDPEPGTTRDYLSEWIDLGGYAVNLVDTAGQREVAGRVEKQGQAKARELIEKADLVLWVSDLSLPGWREDMVLDATTLGETPKLMIGNKLDLVPDVDKAVAGEILTISCVSRTGLEEVRSAILSLINDMVPDLTSGQVVTSARHKRCLDLAADGVGRTMTALLKGESADILAFELRQAADHLGEITGQVYTEEILGEIFSRFCIGK